MKQQLTSHQFLDENGNPEGGHTYATGLTIAWQRGPLGRGADRLEPNGCFVETVTEAAVDRLEFYQRTKFKSDYNDRAISLLRSAMAALAQRTLDREQRGVEGTHKD